MKRAFVALILLVCLPLVLAQKTRYGQEPPHAKPSVAYPLRVHISGIRIRGYCDSRLFESRYNETGAWVMS